MYVGWSKAENVCLQEQMWHWKDPDLRKGRGNLPNILYFKIISKLLECRQRTEKKLKVKKYTGVRSLQIFIPR